MLATATITGIFYGTNGAPVTNADVYIVPKQKYVASIGGSAWVPRSLTGVTNASGEIGTLDGETFVPGLALGVGQHDISVREGGTSHNGVLTVDTDMVASAGAIELNVALQPAPAPELVAEAIAALVAAAQDVLTLSINEKSVDYTLALTDALNGVEMNGPTALTLTIPNDQDVNFPLNTQVLTIRGGSGLVTIAPAAGVSIVSATGLSLEAEGSAAILLKRGTNYWLAVGGLV